MITSLGGDVKPLALSPSSLYFSWKGTYKNLWHCSKRVGTYTPMSWSIWLAASSVWVGEVWSKHRLRWLQKCAFTCWCLISPLCFLRNSAIGCKWGKLAPFILFYLFFFFFKQDMFVKFLFALIRDRLSNWTYNTPMPKVPRSPFLSQSLSHNPSGENCSNR